VDLKDIKDLMNAMRRTGTKRIMIKKKEFEIELERDSNEICKSFEAHPESEEESLTQRANMALSRGGVMPTHHYSPTEVSPPPAQVEKKEQKVTNTITSPMVGTFYTSPSPDDPIFVKIGDRVEKDTVVCIIEAMKVMNEVKAGISGRVEEVLVENGHPVEFGTKLFRIS
jgi:acetyl-CoA carboxylase biotin carboxyl carrier protein